MIASLRLWLGCGLGPIARGLALLVGVVCLLLGLWESVVRLPGVMRVLLPGDVLVSSRFGASC